MCRFTMLPALVGAMGLLASAVEAPAQDKPYQIDQLQLEDAGVARNVVSLLHGHAIYHRETGEAGVGMGLLIEGGEYGGAALAEACRELQRLSELQSETGGGLALATIFVAPSRDMAVEGFYLPSDGHFGSRAFADGKRLDGSTIAAVIALAGIPGTLLQETNVEQEISCQLDEPAWAVTWQDIRMIEDQQPAVIIERARARFMLIYRDVVQNGSYTH